MITELERFPAASDTGASYTVVLLQHWGERRPLDGSTQRFPTYTEWKTACGMDLNQKSPDVFEMIQRDEILHRA